MQDVTTKMREKEIKNMEWIDREEWRNKIKLQAQKCVKTIMLSTIITIIESWNLRINLKKNEYLEINSEERYFFSQC